MLPIPVPRVSPPLFDSTLGQLPLESLKAFRRDLCPLDLQFPEFLEADNYRNAGVTDRQTASQVQNFQLNQPLQIRHPLVANPGFIQAELLEAGEFAKMHLSLVGDLGTVEEQPVEPGKFGEVGHCSVCDLGLGEVDRANILERGKMDG